TPLGSGVGFVPDYVVVDAALVALDEGCNEVGVGGIVVGVEVFPGGVGWTRPGGDAVKTGDEVDVVGDGGVHDAVGLGPVEAVAVGWLDVEPGEEFGGPGRAHFAEEFELL